MSRGLLDVLQAAMQKGLPDIHAELIRDDFLTSRRLWLQWKASDHTRSHPENPYAGAFIWVEEHIMRLMGDRTIRAWHYTRMTDGEVAALRRDGVHVSISDRTRDRLAA